jgi:hypothetical protein
MHHESELSDEVRAAFEKALAEGVFGPTGNFPDGKLTNNDEGELAFGVTAYHGKVLVNLGEPIASLGMSPKQARDLALLLRKLANEIDRTPGL